MTDQDHERFAQGLTALGLAFRVEVDDATCEAYWAGLDDVLIDHALWATREAMKRCNFFPSVAALRSLADRAARMEHDEADLFGGKCLPPGEEDRRAFEAGPHALYHCARCEDTGFIVQTCTRDEPCGMRGCPAFTEPDHRYAMRCPCRETNPVFLRRMREKGRYHREV